ncbi:MAG: ATP phosphoribosyltransferase [Candidatus Bathyarchaeota archaeon]|nr:ATP phosphoribosyltransferase [Candidatus Bathyarchaeota archaeon]
MKVKLAVPAGSLQKATFEVFEKAGYRVSGQERSYRPAINDPEIELRILRPQEIPILVSEGLYDVGISGYDWIKETDADVELLQNLEYGKVRLVAAVPKSWADINSFSSLLETFLANGKSIKISTEYLNITARYVQNNPVYRKFFGDLEPLTVTPWWRKGQNPKVAIFLSFGATEAKPPEVADAIVDVTETGTSLEQNNLKIIEVLLESTAFLIANKKSLQSGKQEKIFDIKAMLKGVVDGSKRLHIFVNVKKENLKPLLKELPALKRPTVSPLADKGWYAVNTVIDRDDFFKILPTIRKLAQGLVVYEPRQVLALEEG